MSIRRLGEDLLQGVHQRMLALAASAPEVVEIKGPDHTTAQAHIPHVLGLLSDHVVVVEADPLVALVSVRAQTALWVLDYLPAAVVNPVADLVVGEESRGLGELASCAGARGRV